MTINSNYIILTLRLVGSLASGVLLLLAWELDSIMLGVIGSCLYLLLMGFDLYSNIKLAKQYRDGLMPDKEEKASFLTRCTQWIEAVITLSSFVMILNQQKHLQVCGVIIWVGTLYAIGLHKHFARNIAGVDVLKSPFEKRSNKRRKKM